MVHRIYFELFVLCTGGRRCAARMPNITILHTENVNASSNTFSDQNAGPVIPPAVDVSGGEGNMFRTCFERALRRDTDSSTSSAEGY